MKHPFSLQTNYDRFQITKICCSTKLHLEYWLKNKSRIFFFCIKKFFNISKFDNLKYNMSDTIIEIDSWQLTIMNDTYDKLIFEHSSAAISLNVNVWYSFNNNNDLFCHFSDSNTDCDSDFLLLILLHFIAHFSVHWKSWNCSV